VWPCIQGQEKSWLEACQSHSWVINSWINTDSVVREAGGFQGLPGTFLQGIKGGPEMELTAIETDDTDGPDNSLTGPC